MYGISAAEADVQLFGFHRGKIVEGRVAKTVSRGALLEQPFIRDTAKTVNEVVKETIAALGENINVRRFERCVCKSSKQ